MLKQPFTGDLVRLQRAIKQAWLMNRSLGTTPDAYDWARSVWIYHSRGDYAKVSPTYEDVCSAATVLRNKATAIGSYAYGVSPRDYDLLRAELGCNTHIIPTDWPPPGGHSSQRPERSEGDRMFDFFFPKKKDGGFLGLPSWKRRRR